jgi:hypothetical protein
MNVGDRRPNLGGFTLTYVVSIYNTFEQRVEKVHQVLRADQWDDHAKNWWANHSRFLKDWQGYYVQEFDLDGVQTNRGWLIVKGSYR